MQVRRSSPYVWIAVGLMTLSAWLMLSAPIALLPTMGDRMSPWLMLACALIATASYGVSAYRLFARKPALAAWVFGFALQTAYLVVQIFGSGFGGTAGAFTFVGLMTLKNLIPGFLIRREERQPS